MKKNLILGISLFVSLIIFIYMVIMSLLVASELNYDLSIENKNLILDYFNTSYVLSPEIETQIEDVEMLYAETFKIKFVELNAQGMVYLPLKTIYINKNISSSLFATTLAHEAQHTKWVVREYMATYNSLIMLWESDMPYIKYQVKLYITRMLNGRYTKNYDCSLLLFNYVQLRS
jgi:hypothetical protein